MTYIIRCITALIDRLVTVLIHISTIKQNQQQQLLFCQSRRPKGAEQLQ